MKITISGQQLALRDSMKYAVNQKLKKFDKFFGEDTPASVLCKVRKGIKIVEITVTYRGTLFRAEEESETFLTALERAVETLERQIRKNKTKLEKTIMRSTAFQPTEEDDDEYVEDEAPLVRTKTYSMRPMNVEEAILQMNLIEHDFFVFFCEDYNGICTVYRRRDGGYGLLVPET